MSGGTKVSVNTAGEGAGARISDMGTDRPAMVVDKGVQGEQVTLQTSGANVTPPEAKAAPTAQNRTLDQGPKVDGKTNSYGKAVYRMTVTHNSNGGKTDLVREDR
jgi:hypothetical protein